MPPTGKDLNWSSLGVKYRVGNIPTKQEPRKVFIEIREQMDDSILWVCISDGFVLSKRGHFVYEPRPSSRSDKFIEDTRFKTKEDAFDLFARVYEKGNIQMIFEEDEE